MNKLSRELAEYYYEKLSAIHNFKYLSLAQKVSIFFQDLEHDILSKITGKQEFFDQWNLLKDNQLQIIDKNKKIGSVPPTLVTDIHSFKPWRNEAVHKSSPSINMVTYLKLFQTIAQTINYFSEIEWSNDINNIINNQTITNEGIQSPKVIKSLNSVKNNLPNFKIPFELIDNENDIKNNILKFKYILENERTSHIISLFSSFTYWYYFSGLDIFVPNKFLGYKNCANTPYENGCKMNGTVARNKLSNYFDFVLDENRKSILLSKFNKFSSDLGQNVNINTTFLEPNKKYQKDFSNI